MGLKRGGGTGLKMNEEHAFARSNTMEYFDWIREQLRVWPYTVHQIDDTLDCASS